MVSSAWIVSPQFHLWLFLSSYSNLSFHVTISPPTHSTWALSGLCHPVALDSIEHLFDSPFDSCSDPHIHIVLECKFQNQGLVYLAQICTPSTWQGTVSKWYLDDAWLLTDSFIQTLIYHLYMIIFKMEKNEPKKTVICPGRTTECPRIYALWLLCQSFFYLSYLFIGLKKCSTFLVSNRESLNIWSFKAVAGWVLFHWKAGASLFPLGRLTSLISKALLFHLWVTKSLLHTINPSSSFLHNCISWQLWITGAMKIPEELMLWKHISQRQPVIPMAALMYLQCGAGPSTLRGCCSEEWSGDEGIPLQEEADWCRRIRYDPISSLSFARSTQSLLSFRERQALCHDVDQKENTNVHCSIFDNGKKAGNCNTNCSPFMVLLNLIK